MPGESRRAWSGPATARPSRPPASPRASRPSSRPGSPRPRCNRPQAATRSRIEDSAKRAPRCSRSASGSSGSLPREHGDAGDGEGHGHGELDHAHRGADHRVDRLPERAGHVRVDAEPDQDAGGDEGEAPHVGVVALDGHRRGAGHALGDGRRLGRGLGARSGGLASGRALLGCAGPGPALGRPGCSHSGHNRTTSPMHHNDHFGHLTIRHPTAHQTLDRRVTWPPPRWSPPPRTFRRDPPATGPGGHIRARHRPHRFEPQRRPDPGIDDRGRRHPSHGPAGRRRRRGRHLPRRAAPPPRLPRPPRSRPAAARADRSSGSRPWRPPPTTPSTSRRATSAEVLIPWGTPLVARRSGLAAGRLQHRRRPGAAGRLQPRRHPLLPARPWPAGQRARPAGAQPRVHRRQPDLLAAQGSAITPDAAGAKVAKALAGHGVTVVEIRRDRDGPVEPRRRLAATTAASPAPPRWPSPARSADHPSCSPNNAPMGTLNNCGHGATPWGTYLACEENWNGYFGTADPTFAPTAAEARYGVARRRVRLPLAQAPTPASTSRVNRARGSTASAGSSRSTRSTRAPRRSSAPPWAASSTRAPRHASRSGRVVVYSGDDQNGDYLYKFVGDAPWQHHRARGAARSTTAPSTSPGSTTTAPASGCRWSTARAR